MVEQSTWQTQYPEGIDWYAEIKPEPLYVLVDEAAAKYGKRVALDFMGYQLTYDELQQQVNRAAAGFRALGVKKGVHVGLFLPTCPQAVISYFAILKAGGTVVNFSPLYSENELKYQVEDSDIEVMVTLNLEALYPKIAPLVGVGKLRHLVVGTLLEVLPAPKNILFALFKRSQIATVQGGEGYSSFVELCDHEPLAAPATIDPENDVALIQYTGGTTGVPKGAMLSHTNVLANARQCSMWCPIEHGTATMLIVLPLFHVFAMTACMNSGLEIGATMVMLPRFEVPTVLKTIAKHQPHIMHGVPAMYNAIANHSKTKRYNLRSLVACISGGAPLPLDVKERFEQLTGCHLVEGYGLTESAPVAACNPVSEAAQTGTIGLAFPGTTLSMIDPETRKEVPMGERGELCISGPQVMLGYYKRPDATAECIDELPDGTRRLRTGDIAIQREDGFVQIVDRIKDMIIMSGYNVYPRNVEEAIYTHESVAECAVIGVADDKRGEAVKAFVVLQDGAVLDKAELVAYFREHVGKHELPTYVEFRDDLPKTMIGKVDKKALS